MNIYTFVLAYALVFWNARCIHMAVWTVRPWNPKQNWAKWKGILSWLQCQRKAPQRRFGPKERIEHICAKRKKKKKKKNHIFKVLLKEIIACWYQNRSKLLKKLLGISISEFLPFHASCKASQASISSSNFKKKCQMHFPFVTGISTWRGNAFLNGGLWKREKLAFCARSGLWAV